MQFFDRLLPRQHQLPLLFLILLSYLTVVHGFWNPTALFWDENYHIASAQKYMNGVFFMEPHPPLGKMLIAAGEVLLDQNPADDQFIGTDYATNPPEGFSFLGYRLFPVLFAWFMVPILYGIFMLLTGRPLWAMLLTLLPTLDNALLVHARSAMLDSIMLFFCMLVILAFLALIRKHSRDTTTLLSVLFGVAFACALATKAFALLFVLLVPLIGWKLWKDRSTLIRVSLFAGIPFLVVFGGIWYAHFALGQVVIPALPDDGYYQSSDAGKAIVDAGRTASPLAFPVLLRDAFAFVPHYEKGVPSLDLCKDDENGGPWFLWPIGARSITYRWETADSYAYRYLTLVVNPVAWGAALLALIVGIVLFFGPFLMNITEKQTLRFELGTFLLLYACYMAAISQIDRVMYLYHYFLPLLFTFMLIGIVTVMVDRIGPLKLTEERKTLGLLGLAVLTFVSFQIYRPFTYYEPITDDAVTRRAIIDLWDMHCVECDAPHPLAIPTKS